MPNQRTQGLILNQISDQADAFLKPCSERLLQSQPGVLLERHAARPRTSPALPPQNRRTMGSCNGHFNEFITPCSLRTTGLEWEIFSHAPEGQYPPYSIFLKILCAGIAWPKNERKILSDVNKSKLRLMRPGFHCSSAGSFASCDLERTTGPLWDSALSSPK